MFRENVILFTIFGIVLTGVLVLMGFVIQQDHKRSEMAEQYGCTYLGTARDLIGVTFYKCNNEIIMKPSGQHP